MASRADQTKPTAAELADLSALADGTLDPARRADVEARIARLAGADRAVRARAPGGRTRCTRRGRPSVPPQRLRAKIEASRPSGAASGPPALRLRRRRGRGARRRGARAGAGASVGNARRAVGVRRGGAGRSRSGSGGPRARSRPCPQGGCTRTSATSTSPTGPRGSDGRPSGPAPTSSAGTPRSPSTTGGRTSRSPTRSCIRRRCPSRRRQATNWDGTELRTLELNGRLVVTWRRAGDTCVLSGTGIKAGELQRLAAWKVPADSD